MEAKRDCFESYLESEAAEGGDFFNNFLESVAADRGEHADVLMGMTAVELMKDWLDSRALKNRGAYVKCLIDQTVLYNSQLLDN